jgi:hypothetical protein
MKNSILKFAGLNALGTTLYILLVATFLSNTSRIFGGNSADNTALIPTAMILLLVLSASVTGSLVMGRPILWYLDGKKKEAVSLFITTIGFLFFITLLAFAALAFFQK